MPEPTHLHTVTISGESDGFPLLRVQWVDAHNNQGAWMNKQELEDFAKDEAFHVQQVGYRVYEDDLCIVLAARLSKPSLDYGQSFGMCERIPKRLIESQVEIETVMDADSGEESFRDV